MTPSGQPRGPDRPPAPGVPLPDPEATRDLGERVARLLRPGDIVVLTGELGAGKTTLTQGIGLGLQVRGPVTSPTFVIARVHPSLVGGPDLVHVDAYRLDGAVEVDDLDLDADLDHAVLVVEWGAGLVERMSPDRLEVLLTGRSSRTARIVGVGARWAEPTAAAELAALSAPPPRPVP